MLSWILVIMIYAQSDLEGAEPLTTITDRYMTKASCENGAKERRAQLPKNVRVAWQCQKYN